MLEVRFLGVLDLRRDGETLAGVLAQPRRVALLAYLAVATRGGFTRRDVLVSMFWPELDAERSRAALRQQLHGLRTGLGEDALVSRGQEEVGLEPTSLTCDVLEFLDAVEAGDLERAAKVYGGPFLEGFHVADAPGFARWVEDTREALARRNVAALETLGTGASDRRDYRAAINWWTLLLKADPYNTPAAIQLMKALAGAGDRPNAVVAGERHAAHLRDDLQVEPSRAFQQLLADLREVSAPGMQRSEPVPPTPEVSAGRLASAAPVAEASAPLQQIGPYRILRLVAEGGMGAVYEAEQTEPVKRRVALKLIQEALSSPEVLARFEAERQALAVMEHPAIAKVYDAGALGGTPYFVMEYVDGVSLTDYCDAHRLSTRERVKLFIAVCEAVQHAHQKGVIHRDLKPSNVLVTEQAGRAMPKVIDFGIAKAMGVKLTDRTLATAHGMIVGTPAYMSPEQAEGMGMDVDTRSDVYALGVMLYQLLVGRLPLDPGEIGLLPFIARLVARQTDPKTPSDRLQVADVERLADLRRTVGKALRRELKGDLDWIVMKALAPERERRYETVNALALELERYLKHEPVRARPPSVAYRARKFARRNRIAVAAAGLALMAMVGGTVAATLSYVRATRAARTATRTSNFLASLMEFGDPGRMRGGNPTARDILDDGRARIETDLAGEPLIQARIYLILARSNYYLGRWAIADSVGQRSLALMERSVGADGLDLMGPLTALFYSRDQAASEEPLVRRALEISRKQPEPIRSGGVAHAYVMQSQLRLWRREFESAEAELKEAITTLEAYLDPERRRPELGDFSPRERLAHAFNQLALLYAQTQRLDDERDVYQRSLALTERTLGPEHPDAAIALNVLADIAGMRGQLAEAESLARRAVKVRMAAENGIGSVTARYVGTLGGVLFRAGRLAEAESLLTIASERARPDIAQHALDELAMVVLSRGRAAEAERFARKALQRAPRSSVHDTVAHVAAFSVTLGEALLAQRRFRDAQAAFAPAAALYLRADSLHDGNGRALAGLARAAAATGRRADAERNFEHALALQERNHRADTTLVDRRRDLLRTLDAYAAFLRSIGRPEDATVLERRGAEVRHPVSATGTP